MDEARDLLDPASVARIERLEIVARHVVDGFLRGLHRSSRHGASIEFAEHRPYVPGEDPRHLDWRSWARTDRLWVKRYEDETNLLATLVVDASASMGYSSGGASKLGWARALAAAVGWLLLGQRDAVGLAAVGDRLREHLPPRAATGHLAQVFRALEALEPEGPTRLGPVLEGLAERLPGRSLVVVLSDLIDDAGAVLHGLARLRERGAEVVVFAVSDPAEEDLPASGWTVLVDPEDPGRPLRVDARQARAAYRAGLAAHRDVLRRGCAAAEIDLLRVSTDEPFELALARWAGLRSPRP